MAARRHARKAAFRRAAMQAPPRSPCCGCWQRRCRSARPPPNTSWSTAIAGWRFTAFDPVAYFTDGAPVLGKGEFEHRHAGVVWRFRNSGNLAAFAADPEVYMPRFGGYDPVGLSRNVPLAGDPRIWLIDERAPLSFSNA